MSKTCVRHEDFKDLRRRTVCVKTCAIVNHSMTDISMNLHKWSTNSLIRRLYILVFIQGLEVGFLRINNWPINNTSQTLESLKRGRYIIL